MKRREVITAIAVNTWGVLMLVIWIFGKGYIR